MSICDSNSSAVSTLGLRLGRWAPACVLAAGLLGCSAAYAADTAAKAPATAAVPAGIESFDTPEQAASAIVAAAQVWDTAKLSAMLGPDGDEIIFTGDYTSDRQRGADFAAQAARKTRIAVDPTTGQRAIVLVGENDFAVPGTARQAQRQVDLRCGRWQSRAHVPAHR